MQIHLRQVARARLRELGLRQKDLAGRIYNVEQVTGAQLNMVARLLSGKSTMLARNGLCLLQALGLRTLEPVWQAGVKKAGDPKALLPLPPQISLEQQLARAANQRRFDLGWTQNDVALRIIGPRSGEPISEKRVAAFLNGHAQLFSKVGLEILHVLGLDRLEVIWQPTEQVAVQNASPPQFRRNVQSDTGGLSTRTPRPRISAEFSRQELHQLEVEAQVRGVTVERLIRNAALATLELDTRYTAAQLRSIRAEANARGHEWSLEELQARNLPLFWNEIWTREQLTGGRSISQIALLAGGWPIRSAGNYISSIYGIAVFKPRLSRVSQQVLNLKIDAGQSRAEAGAELGVSRFVAARYAKNLPSERDRKFEAKVAAVGEWPATTARIAEVLFEGQRNRAASWCRSMVKSGRLLMIRRGVYNTQ